MKLSPPRRTFASSALVALLLLVLLVAGLPPIADAQAATKTISGTLLLGGAPVANAFIQISNSQDPALSSSARTDSNGQFSASVTGGDWQVFPLPLPSDQWIFLASPVAVSFANDTSIEARTVALAVVATDGIVQGRVVLPDGSTLPPACPACAFQIDLFVTVSSVGAPLVTRTHQLFNDGSFSVPMIAGSYNLQISLRPPVSDRYRPPAPVRVDVTRGAVQVGTLPLLPLPGTLRGRVSSGGAAVRGAIVNAFDDRGLVASSLTSFTGAYTLTLTPGSYEVAVEASPSLGLVDDDEAQEATVESDRATTLDFALTAAAAQLAGQLVRGEGAGEQLASDVAGAVFAHALDDPSAPTRWASLSEGRFVLNLPSGRYSVGAVLPANSTAGTVPPIELEVPAPPAPVQTLPSVAVKLRLLPDDATIGGVLRSSAGPVRGLAAEIVATPADGDQTIWSSAPVDPATGSYSLQLPSGRWYIGYELDQPNEQFLDSSRSLALVTVARGGNSYDVALVALDGVVRGRLVDRSTRTPLPNQRIALNGPGVELTASTGADGQFELFVPLRAEDGTQARYSVVVEDNCPTLDDCVIGGSPTALTAVPRSAQVVVSAAHQQVVPDISAARCSSTSCTLVNLDLRLQAGGNTVTAASVNVRLFGQSSYINAQLSGNSFRASVPVPVNQDLAVGDSATFNVRAAGSGFSLRPNPSTVSEQIQRPLLLLGEPAQTQVRELELNPIPNYPDTTVAQFEAAAGWSATLRDGTTVLIPPGAVPLNSGDAEQVTVIVQPSFDLPLPAAVDGAAPYGYTLRISKTTATGSVELVRELLQPAQISFRLDDALLLANEVSPGRVRPAVLSEQGWAVASVYSADLAAGRIDVLTRTTGLWALIQPARNPTLYLLLIGRR